ncbi:MAG: glycosyltransferase [Planctomycetes bacterium]|nr:glycosyltransferase [Planctomycetota bacterium]
MADVSAVILSYNSAAYVVECVRSLRREASRAGIALELVIVDNRSPELERDKPILEAIAAESGAELLFNDRNSGYSGGMNFGLRATSAPVLAILNPDLCFFEGSLEKLHRHVVEHRECGVAGPMGFYDLDRAVALPPNPLPDLADHWRQVYAHLTPGLARAYARHRSRVSYRYWTLERPTALPMLSGCCMVLRRDVLPTIGGLFDERFPLYYEDADFYRRVGRAGLECTLVPDAHIAHFYGRSSATDGGEAMRRYHIAQQEYYRKWYGPLRRALGYELGKKVIDWWPGKWKKRPPLEPVDLGRVVDPPSIEVPTREPFFLELSMDPMFFLAGGIVRATNPFAFSALAWRSIGYLRYFVRAVDVATMRTLRVWTFERIGAEAAP